MEIEEEFTLSELFVKLVKLELNEDLRTNPDYFDKKIKVFVEASTYFGLMPIGLKMNTPQGFMIRKMYRRAIELVLNEYADRTKVLMASSLSYSRLYSFSTPHIQYSLAKTLCDGEIIGSNFEIKYDSVIIVFIQKERTYGLYYDFRVKKLDILFSLSMNKFNPIDSSEIFHMLKWYYKKENGKSVENDDFKNTPFLIHGLDFKSDKKKINIKTEELTKEDFNTEDEYNVYMSFAPYIKRYRIDREFYLVNDKDTYFNWFNPATGYLMMNTSDDFAVYMEVDKTTVYEKKEVIEEGKEVVIIRDKKELTKKIPDDINKGEYSKIYNKLKEILYLNLFKENFENLPIFEWVRDTPVLLPYEIEDNIINENKHVVEEIVGDNVILNY